MTYKAIVVREANGGADNLINEIILVPESVAGSMLGVVKIMAEKVGPLNISLHDVIVCKNDRDLNNKSLLAATLAEIERG